MSTTVTLHIEQNLDPNPDSGVFRRRAKNTASGQTVIINHIDGSSGTSRYTTNGTPTATLRLIDADYHTIWNCPVPSVGDHKLTYDEAHPISAGVYRVTSYQHCSGTVVFP